MLIGGLDIGTTGCKLSIYDEDGAFVTNAYKEYNVSRKSGAHEIDAEEIFSAVLSVLCEILQTHVPSAIGVTSFGESFVLLDGNDRALLPTMLYTDPRGDEECKRLVSQLGEERIMHAVGVKAHPMYSLPKLMWVKEHLPEVYAQTKHVLLMQDYIVYMLTGIAQIDYSLAARTMAFDIQAKCWDADILRAAEIDPALLSAPVPSGTLAASLKPKLARMLNVTKEIKIVSCAHDQVAALVGCGIFEPGTAMDGTGTVECVVPVFRGVPTARSLYEEGYSVVPYVGKNLYVCYALSFTGGATLKWFRDNFASTYGGAANVYAALDAAVPSAPTGILVLPHFAGAANPYMDNGSKAAMIGLTLEHTTEDLYKALMEGVTYEIMTNLEHLAAAGVSIEKLYATGGGARSSVWLQIKADVLGREIYSLSAKEVGACGSCMMTAVAIGLFDSLEKAKACFVREDGKVTPRADQHELYEKYYGAYRRIYDAVRPIVREVEA